MGGLGCAVSDQLVRAGIGRLILLDDGVVDEPDLNRQILFTMKDLGKAKVEAAAARLSAIHGRTRITPLDRRIEENESFLREMRRTGFTGIADCLDDFHSRFVLERLLEEPEFLVHGGVQNDCGQVTTLKKGATGSLRELHPHAKNARAPLPVCPSIVACIGSLMAHEVMNNIWNRPRLINRMLAVELSDFTFSEIRLD
jgi:molybdopterin/thiamine biosynthesis adenylyltransferase